MNCRRYFFVDLTHWWWWWQHSIILSSFFFLISSVTIIIGASLPMIDFLFLQFNYWKLSIINFQRKQSLLESTQFFFPILIKRYSSVEIQMFNCAYFFSTSGQNDSLHWEWLNQIEFGCSIFSSVCVIQWKKSESKSNQMNGEKLFWING